MALLVSAVILFRRRPLLNTVERMRRGAAQKKEQKKEIKIRAYRNFCAIGALHKGETQATYLKKGRPQCDILHQNLRFRPMKARGAPRNPLTTTPQIVGIEV